MTKAERITKAWVGSMNNALYGPDSVFTAEEQDAMRTGYTISLRMAESGRVFGGYPQAISEDHARKLNVLNGIKSR
jgi:hypothetical protein